MRSPQPKAFTVNQRVRVSFPIAGDRRRYRYGIVRGFSRDGATVRVQEEGRKTVSNYHPDFLDPIGPEAR